MVITKAYILCAMERPLLTEFFARRERLIAELQRTARKVNEWWVERESADPTMQANAARVIGDALGGDGLAAGIAGGDAGGMALHGCGLFGPGQNNPLLHREPG
jgi:hypothetical protein